MRLSDSFCLLTVLVLSGGTTWAEDEVLVVHTEYRSHDTWRADPSVPGDRLASRPPTELALQASPPPGVREPLPAANPVYGEIRIGTRRVPLAFGTLPGEEGLLALDLDGDGVFRGAGETQRLPVQAGGARGPARFSWRAGAVPIGGARLALAFQLGAPTLEAVLVDGAPLPIELLEKPPPGVRAGSSTTAVLRYGRVRAGGKELAIAFLRGAGDACTLYVDRNANGDLGDEGERFGCPLAERQGDVAFWKLDGVAIGTATVSLALKETAGTMTASVTAAGALRGTTTWDGRPFSLHLLDGDLDGTFTSTGDRWWFGPRGDLEKVRRLVPDAMVEATEPVFAGGAWRLQSLGQDGRAVLVRDPNAGTIGEYLRRRAKRVNETRWFPAFRQEEVEFRARLGMQPGRPLAPRPPEFMHDADLAQSLEQARRENRPVFADFEADWCVWCKRYDFYVYPDAEVAELLSHFVLVKVNAEFNYAGDLDRLGAESLPFLTFLAPDGSPITYSETAADGTVAQVSGPTVFQRPDQFAETLRRAWQAWQARQGR